VGAVAANDVELVYVAGEQPAEDAVAVEPAARAAEDGAAAMVDASHSGRSERHGVCAVAHALVPVSVAGWGWGEGR